MVKNFISWKIFRHMHKRNLIQYQTLTNSESKSVQVKSRKILKQYPRNKIIFKFRTLHVSYL